MTGTAIRPLDSATDRDSVARLFLRSADYVRLEYDEEPTEAFAEDFFGDHVPGGSLATQLKLGLFGADGQLAGLADLGFGYPEPGDAYLGLLQFATEARGQGLGRALLARVEAETRARGARRLFIAVLHGNPRGRAFWLREGFTVAAENLPITLGNKAHLATRMVKPL